MSESRSPFEILVSNAESHRLVGSSGDAVSMEVGSTSRCWRVGQSKGAAFKSLSKAICGPVSRTSGGPRTNLKVSSEISGVSSTSLDPNIDENPELATVPHYEDGGGARWLIRCCELRSTPYKPRRFRGGAKTRS